MDSQNNAPDALSRQQELLLLMGLSTPIFNCIPQLQQSYAQDPEVQKVWNLLVPAPNTSIKRFLIINDMLHYKQQIFVPLTSQWPPKLLDEFHASLQGGHSASFEHTKDSPKIFYGWEFGRKQKNLWLNTQNVSAKILRIYTLMGYCSPCISPLAYGRTSLLILLKGSPFPTGTL